MSFSLAALLPITQALKCIVCISSDGLDKACDEATTAATECTSPQNEVCLSLYVAASKSMVRSCSSTALADSAITSIKSRGKGEK